MGPTRRKYVRCLSIKVTLVTEVKERDDTHICELPKCVNSTANLIRHDLLVEKKTDYVKEEVEVYFRRTDFCCKQDRC
jgi:hypothetical protein